MTRQHPVVQPGDRVVHSDYGTGRVTVAEPGEYWVMFDTDAHNHNRYKGRRVASYGLDMAEREAD